MVDLHMHSIASLDGTYSAKELIDFALKANLEYMAICDHDEVSSIDEASEYAKANNIRFIKGIEISTIMDKHPLHILGYNIDHHDPRFSTRSKYVQECTKLWAVQAIRKTQEFGFSCDADEIFAIAKNGIVCEENIGEIVLNDQRNDKDERLLPFREGGKLSDNPTFNFYKTFFSPNGPLYIEYDFNLPLSETAKLIKETGGKMFLAHPAYNIGLNEDLLKQIISFGLDGIEVFSSYHDAQAVSFYYDMAKKYDLHMSVGSDFHGALKPSIKMGSIDYDHDELDRTLKFLGVKQ